MRPTSPASILGYGTAVPATRWTTAELLDELGDLLSDELRASIQRMGVASRHTAASNLPELIHDPRARPALTTTTTRLALDALERALDDAGVAAEEVGLLVAVTNSQGKVMPGLAHDLMGQDRGLLGRDAATVNMQGQGCSTLLKAFEVAGWFLRAKGGVALVVASEVQTPCLNACGGAGQVRSLREVHDRAGDPSSDELDRSLAVTQSFLFGDGAAAFVLGRGSGLAAKGFAHRTNDDHRDVALLEVREGGSEAPRCEMPPRYTMAPAVPQRGAQYVLASLGGLSEAVGPSLGSVEPEALLVHTGSRKILRGVHDALGVDPSAPTVTASYRVLERYGNLSSAATGFMLADVADRVQTALAVAFGVGFSASAALFASDCSQ